MTGAISLDLLPSQVAVLESTKRFVAVSGGLGCGKSFGLGVKAFQLATMWYGEQGFLVSKTHKQLFDFLMPEIRKVFNVLAPGHWEMKGGNKIILDYGGQSSTIHLLLANNMSYLNWPGANIGWAIMDEWDTMDRALEVWSYLNDRVRLVPNKSKGQYRQTAVFSSPEGYNAMYKKFLKGPMEDASLLDQYELIYGCTFDNPNIDPDYVRDQILSRDPRQAQAYLYGRFCTLSGAVVYDRYKPELNKQESNGASDGNHTKRKLTDFDKPTIHWGFDWNKGINPATAHVIDRDKGEVYALTQVRGLKTAVDTIAKIKSDFDGYDQYFYPDSTNFEALEALKAAFGPERIIYTPGNPPVDKRVGALHHRIHDAKSNQRRYFVNPDTCPHLDDSLQHQMFDDNDRPDKKGGYDHDPDSTGYVVYHQFPVEPRPTPRLITL
jgi:hypothetical protein